VKTIRPFSDARSGLPIAAITRDYGDPGDS
jgi:hypothetical protein